MSRYLKIFFAAISSLFLVASLAACTSQPTEDMTTYAAVIDVRTPQEFASGHLEGALNFDIEGSNFVAELATLDQAGDYYIYCRSGNRAGQAISFMTENGFTGTLKNGGGVNDASSATGLAIIQN